MYISNMYSATVPKLAQHRKHHVGHGPSGKETKDAKFYQVRQGYVMSTGFYHAKILPVSFMAT